MTYLKLINERLSASHNVVKIYLLWAQIGNGNVYLDTTGRPTLQEAVNDNGRRLVASATTNYYYNKRGPLLMGQLATKLVMCQLKAATSQP